MHTGIQLKNSIAADVWKRNGVLMNLGTGQALKAQGLGFMASGLVFGDQG